ncbi:MAG TPA: hypothetical protein ENK51_00400 [Gammaproteobacteria bacterium]|nr:hypothetical protein [Gammaproteobacteria bacterium]
MYWYDDDRKVLIHERSYDATLGIYVYRFGSSSDAPRRQLTGDIIVKFSGIQSADSLADFQARYSVTLVKNLPVGTGYYIFSAIDRETSLDIANQIYRDDEVQFAYPDWLTLGR